MHQNPFPVIFGGDLPHDSQADVGRPISPRDFQLATGFALPPTPSELAAAEEYAEHLASGRKAGRSKRERAKNSPRSADSRHKVATLGSKTPSQLRSPQNGRPWTSCNRQLRDFDSENYRTHKNAEQKRVPHRTVLVNEPRTPLLEGTGRGFADIFGTTRDLEHDGKKPNIEMPPGQQSGVKVDRSRIHGTSNQEEGRKFSPGQENRDIRRRTIGSIAHSSDSNNPFAADIATAAPLQTLCSERAADQHKEAESDTSGACADPQRSGWRLRTLLSSSGSTKKISNQPSLLTKSLSGVASANNLLVTTSTSNSRERPDSEGDENIGVHFERKQSLRKLTPNEERPPKSRRSRWGILPRGHGAPHSSNSQVAFCNTQPLECQGPSSSSDSLGDLILTGHRGSMSPAVPNRVIKSGMLKKWTDYYKGWKDRFFEVVPGQLRYKGLDANDVWKVLPLTKSEVIQHDELCFCLIHQGQKTLVKSSSPDDLKQWIRAIHEATNFFGNQGDAILTRRSVFATKELTSVDSFSPQPGIPTEVHFESNPLCKAQNETIEARKFADETFADMKKLSTRMTQYLQLMDKESPQGQTFGAFKSALASYVGKANELDERISKSFRSTEKHLEEALKERKRMQRVVKEISRDKFKIEQKLANMRHPKHGGKPGFDKLGSGAASVNRSPPHMDPGRQHRTSSHEFLAEACALPDVNTPNEPPESSAAVPPVGQLSGLVSRDSVKATGIVEDGRENLTGTHSGDLSIALSAGQGRRTCMSEETVAKAPHWPRGISDDEFFDADDTAERRAASEDNDDSEASSDSADSEGGQSASSKASSAVSASRAKLGGSVTGPTVTGSAPDISPGVGATEDASSSKIDSRRYLRTFDSDFVSEETKPQLIKPRTILPMPRTEIKTSLWNLLKDCIGKDLSRVALPVNFNEPTSFLQRLAEDFQYANILKKAAEMTENTKRLLFVTLFCMSPYASAHGRTYKPFNPLLGETFELNLSDIRFLAEQVGHHPPTTAYHARGDQVAVWGHIIVNSRFTGKSLEVTMPGPAHIQLRRPKSTHSCAQATDHFTYQRGRMMVNNVIFGKLALELGGMCAVTNHSTGDYSVIEYVRRGWWTSVIHVVRAVIADRDGRVHYLIGGQWSAQLWVVELNPDRSPRVEPNRVPISGTESGAEIRFPSARPFVEGSFWDELVPLKGWDSKEILWQADVRPSYSGQYYEFGFLTFQLNEALDASAMLPRTDSRFRPDQRALELGNIKEANDEKCRLEEKQRATSRARPRGELDYQPMWFECSVDPVTGEKIWLYRGGYWENKSKLIKDENDCPNESGNCFNSCPDIF